jgi:hypothetical protein
MTCPQCTGRVPAKALWTSTGLSGLVCPHCHSHLCPKASRAVILFAVCIGLGEATLLVLQRRGANFAVGLLGFFAIFAGVYLLTAPSVMKLRVKESVARPLAGRRV